MTAMYEADCQKALTFLGESGINYGLFGSAAMFLLGQGRPPRKDVDILIVEKEGARVGSERKIDRFNEREKGLVIDDSWTRQGVAWSNGSKIEIHSSGRIYEMDVHIQRVGNMRVLAPQDLYGLSIAYGRGSNDPGIQETSLKSARRISERFGLGSPDDLITELNSSTRDSERRRSIFEWAVLMKYAILNLRSVSSMCGVDISNKYPYEGLIPLFALKRYFFGRAVVPFSTGDGVEAFDHRCFQILYNTWRNFGRNILFHQETSN